MTNKRKILDTIENEWISIMKTYWNNNEIWLPTFGVVSKIQWAVEAILLEKKSDNSENLLKILKIIKHMDLLDFENEKLINEIRNNVYFAVKLCIKNIIQQNKSEENDELIFVQDLDNSESDNNWQIHITCLENTNLKYSFVLNSWVKDKWLVSIKRFYNKKDEEFIYEVTRKIDNKTIITYSKSQEIEEWKNPEITIYQNGDKAGWIFFTTKPLSKLQIIENPILKEWNIKDVPKGKPEELAKTDIDMPKKTPNIWKIEKDKQLKQQEKLKNSNYYKNEIRNHLLSENPNDKNRFEDFVWYTKTNKSNWTVIIKNKENGMYIHLNTGVGKGLWQEIDVEIKRYFDEELQEIVYLTKAIVNWIKKIRFLRLKKEGKNNYHSLYVDKNKTESSILNDEETIDNKTTWKNDIIQERININWRELIREQLESQNPHDKNKFEEFIWQTERYWNWNVEISIKTDKWKKIIRLFINWRGEKVVTIKRYFDENLKEFIYEASYIDNKKVNQKKYFCLVNKWDYWDLENIPQPKEVIKTKSDIIEEIENNISEIKENPPQSLKLLEYYMNWPLREFARKHKLNLPELTIIDKLFNREKEIASIKMTNEADNKWVPQKKENVLENLKMLLENKKKELNCGTYEDRQIKILTDLISKLENNKLNWLLKYYFWIESLPYPSSKDEIQKMNIKFKDKRIENDPYQIDVVRMAMHEKTRIWFIQWSPWSWKSRTLTEIARQFVDVGKKVLVVSKNNKAVWELALRLDREEVPILYPHTKDENVSDKIPEELKKYRAYDLSLKPDSSRFSEESNYVVEWMKIFEERQKILKTRWSVTCVTTWYLNSAPITNKWEYDVVLVDEAGTMNELDTIIAFSKTKEKIIFAWDHFQLEPFFNEDDTRKTSQNYKNYIKKSAMELKWLSWYPQAFLAKNYRSHPLLAMLIGALTYDNSIIPNNWKLQEEDTLKIVDVPTQNEFWNEKSRPNKSWEDSFINVPEAKKAIEEFEKAINSGYRMSEVSIISGYNGQIELIKEELKKFLVEKLNIKRQEATKIASRQVCTIDSFQWDENSVIIFSFVRSNNKKPTIWHMDKLNRLNVWFSRSKDRLILLADVTNLKRARKINEDTWKKSEFVEFFNKFDEINENLKELKTIQENAWLFTIREAIQSKNGFLDKKINKEILVLDVIDKFEKYLKSNKFEDVLKNNEAKEEYREDWTKKEKWDDKTKYFTILEELHERALIWVRVLELSDERINNKFELTQYEDFLSDIIDLDYYLDFIDFDSENDIIILKWLKDSNGNNIQIKITKKE